MTETLNIIALISGGKDSLYSIIHCIKHGHKVVALANLQPQVHNNSDGEKGSGTTSRENVIVGDMNSFMFQTVGHTIIPLYAEALGIPLYRRTITGTAMVTDRDYAYVATAGPTDETEDLMPLLRQVLSVHPTANAIVTGAIQSTYQRTRVESVALRLGLVPLSFLWQYPVLPPPPTRGDSVTGLLDDMAAASCDARIIKIASGGIRESLLWSNVVDLRTRQALVGGLAPFFDDDELGLRGAVVGEGGEFETIALDGPSAVWKNGYIDVEVDETSHLLGSGGTSYVNLGRAQLVRRESKHDKAIQDTDSQLAIPIPGLLDKAFADLEESDQEPSNHSTQIQHVFSQTDFASASHNILHVENLDISFNVSANTVQINNICYKTLDDSKKIKESQRAATQMSAIAAAIPTLLQQISDQHSIKKAISTSSIVHTTIILRSMDAFSIINPIYASMFRPGVPNSPARVTIAAPLPDGIDISISIMLDLGPRQRRRGLHVQSRSYWAPANIGPYSQAIAVPLHNNDSESESEDTASHTNTEIVHVAGQIPLVPATMQILEGTTHQQAVLSLQHLWRLGQERQIDAWGFGVAFLATGNNTANYNHDTSSRTTLVNAAEVAANVWNQRHHAAIQSSETEDTSDEEEVDVWHSRYNHPSRRQAFAISTSIGQHLHILPLPHQRHGVIIPPFLAAHVTALPRNAVIEWWSMGLTKLTALISDTKPDESLRFHTKSTAHHLQSSLTLASCHHGSKQTTKLIALFIKRQQDDNILTQKSTRHITLDDVLRDEQDDTNDADLHLVSANAYVATHATTLWDQLSSTSTNPTLSKSTTGNTIPASDMKSNSLADSAAVTYVHELWGHVGYQVKTPASEQNHSAPPLSELDVAFFLRLQTF